MAYLKNGRKSIRLMCFLEPKMSFEWFVKNKIYNSLIKNYVKIRSTLIQNKDTKHYTVIQLKNWMKWKSLESLKIYSF